MINPTESPRLFKSFKDIDESFYMAKEKSVDISELENKKIKLVKNLVESNRNELAYRESIELNREVIDKIFEAERNAVKKISPNRLPSSPTY